MRDQEEQEPKPKKRRKVNQSEESVVAIAEQDMEEGDKKVVTVKRRLAANKQQKDPVKVKEEKKGPAIIKKMGVEPELDTETNSYKWSRVRGARPWGSIVQNRLKEQAMLSGNGFTVKREGLGRWGMKVWKGPRLLWALGCKQDGLDPEKPPLGAIDLTYLETPKDINQACSMALKEHELLIKYMEVTFNKIKESMNEMLQNTKRIQFTQSFRVKRE
jgi:hypothetical protein